MKKPMTTDDGYQNLFDHLAGGKRARAKETPSSGSERRLVLPLWEWIKTDTPIEMWVAKADEQTEYMVIRQRKEWLPRVTYGTRYKRVESIWDNPNHTEPSLEDAKLQCAHHYRQNH